MAKSSTTRPNNYLLALSDVDGSVHFFKPEELASQLMAAGLGDMNPALKLACVNFAKKVKEMRSMQRLSSNLEEVKRLESGVDGMMKLFLETIEKI